jgi:hypothetical protein
MMDRWLKTVEEVTDKLENHGSASLKKLKLISSTCYLSGQRRTTALTIEDGTARLLEEVCFLCYDTDDTRLATKRGRPKPFCLS